MIKKTLYFGNPANLSYSRQQLVWSNPNAMKEDVHPFLKFENERTFPIEDIGFLILDHPQIIITTYLLQKLAENNVIVMTCDDKHHPNGLLLPLVGNNLLSERHKIQVKVDLPTKKRLWKQIISVKILNQSIVLRKLNKLEESNNLKMLSDNVKVGDANNHEATAAAYYWNNLFDFDFKRDPDGTPPNNLLNYGYSIVRSAVARAIVSSGLIPSLGLHHRNKYNPFCLADDLMEPFRPIVDFYIISNFPTLQNIELDTETKRKLLEIYTIDVLIDKETSPLMIACNRMAASLVKCFQKKQRKLSVPLLNDWFI